MGGSSPTTLSSLPKLGCKLNAAGNPLRLISNRMRLSAGAFNGLAQLFLSYHRRSVGMPIYKLCVRAGHSAAVAQHYPYCGLVAHTSGVWFAKTARKVAIIGLSFYKHLAFCHSPLKPESVREPAIGGRIHRRNEWMCISMIIGENYRNFLQKPPRLQRLIGRC